MCPEHKTKLVTVRGWGVEPQEFCAPCYMENSPKKVTVTGEEVRIVGMPY